MNSCDNSRLGMVFLCSSMREYKPPMFALLGAGGLIFGGIVSYILGFWDRVDFKYKEYLLPSKKEMYALVVLCREKKVGQHVHRLLGVSKSAVDSSHPRSEPLQADAAAAYGAPEGAEALNIGLYYNDPNKAPGPRWAIGWSVAARDFKEAQSMAKKANAATRIKDEIVAVRIGPGPILTGRIPWRTYFTPMIAPLFFWSKAFRVFESGSYKAIGNNDNEGAVALEVYVTGPNMKRAWIDYVVLHGDVTNVWNDAFPVIVESQEYEGNQGYVGKV